MVDYYKPINRVVLKKKGLEKLEGLTRAELNVFLELLMRARPLEEFNGKVGVLLMACHKDTMLDKFGYSSRGVIDNMLQRLIKKGVIYRLERQYYAIDKGILEKVEN